MITYTKQETKALEAIEEKYRPQLKAAMADMNKYDISKQREEWIAASNRFYECSEKLHAEREIYVRSAEARAFNNFKGDIPSIVEALKNQIKTFIYFSKALAGDEPTTKERAKQQKLIEQSKVELKEGIERNEKLLEQYPDDQELRKNTEELKELDPERVHEFYYDTIYSDQALHERIGDSFKMYFDFLSKTDPIIYKDLLSYIDDVIKNKERLIADRIEEVSTPETMVNTIYPVNFLTPTDKVSSLAFSNDLSKQVQALAMERRGSKKRITTLASIDFDKLNGAVQIKSRKGLTAYDREVHDAIITLFVDGGNEYITPQMIYQVMTGNPDAYLEKKQTEAISESITKCMYSRLIIDASEEAKAYGFDSFKYDGSLISGERVTATLNGTVAECLRLLRKPVLYEYAEKKNQIGRFDIKLLNSPINKTEEIITLQGYLYRRILSMRGSSNLSKTIVYDTVYNQIEVTAASPGALRKKKSKVRDQVKTILDYWKQEQFILGYAENKRGTTIYSVTIRL